MRGLMNKDTRPLIELGSSPFEAARPQTSIGMAEVSRMVASRPDPNLVNEYVRRLEAWITDFQASIDSESRLDCGSCPSARRSHSTSTVSMGGTRHSSPSEPTRRQASPSNSFRTSAGYLFCL